MPEKESSEEPQHYVQTQPLHEDLPPACHPAGHEEQGRQGKAERGKGEEGRWEIGTIISSHILCELHTYMAVYAPRL